MKDEYEDLYRLAKLATKGNWIAVGAWVENERDDFPDICITAIENYPYPMEHASDKDAKYIAAAQPKNVLKMISEIRKLRKEMKK